MIKTLLTIIVLLALALRLEQRRVHDARTHAAAASLRASNIVAERDSTRDVALENAKVAALLGDSLRVVERRVLQVAQRNDALDRALRRERLARYQGSVAVDSLRRTVVAAPVAGDGGVRRATFRVRQAPYTVLADVEIVERPDSARLAVQVALDPIHVDARVTCAAPDADGIRSASIVASTPSWASVRFDRVEQSPELCRSPALRADDRSRRGRFPAFVIGAGPVFDAHGLVRWGVFVGIGTSIFG